MENNKPMKTIKLSVDINSCKDCDLELLEHEIPSPGKSKFHEGRLMMQVEGLASYLIAWHKGKPVGHILIKWNGLGRDLPDDLKWIPELNSIVVAEGTRRKGVGTSLIKEAEVMVKQKGFKKIGLLVSLNNIEAKRLYGRLGYVFPSNDIYTDSGKMVDDDGNEYIDSEECLAMTKEL